MKSYHSIQWLPSSVLLESPKLLKPLLWLHSCDSHKTRSPQEMCKKRVNSWYFVDILRFFWPESAHFGKCLNRWNPWYYWVPAIMFLVAGEGLELAASGLYQRFQRFRSNSSPYFSPLFWLYAVFWRSVWAVLVYYITLALRSLYWRCVFPHPQRRCSTG